MKTFFSLSLHIIFCLSKSLTPSIIFLPMAELDSFELNSCVFNPWTPCLFASSVYLQIFFFVQ